MPAGRLRVLDPHAAPLAQWHAHTAATGMDFLRSSIVHHIDVDPYGLQHFAASEAGRGVARFARPYRRPSVALFRAHAEAVVAREGLAALRLRGTARRLRRTAAGWALETDRGLLVARHVVLAPGPPPPHWPSWARPLRDADAPVAHLFEPGFSREAIGAWARAVVVGGGISAAQAALALAQHRPGAVTLVMRHAPRIHDLDADPGWLGPKYLEGFHAEPCRVRRRQAIAAARHRGSWPPAVHAAMQRAAARGHLRCVQAAVREASWDGHALRLTLASGEALAADRLVLATGFAPERPGGALVARAVAELGLPVAPCGFPLLDPALRWQAGLFVTGGLAELELGPVARNIAGARMAATRLAAQVTRPAFAVAA
ncbi:MAG: SidA/IucD/PvdA family monooxygenase [Rubricoccaceae bacterium]